MIWLGIVVGLVLGVPFGLLVRGLCEANGEDPVATDLPAVVRPRMKDRRLGSAAAAIGCGVRDRAVRLAVNGRSAGREPA